MSHSAPNDSNYLLKSQSIGSTPFFFKASLIFENGRLPKKPLAAERGDGWADCTIACRSVSINIPIT